MSNCFTDIVVIPEALTTEVEEKVATGEMSTNEAEEKVAEVENAKAEAEANIAKQVEANNKEKLQAVKVAIENMKNGEVDVIATKPEKEKFNAIETLERRIYVQNGKFKAFKTEEFGGDERDYYYALTEFTIQRLIGDY